MASLFSARTTNGAGTGASHSGPCTVFVTGTFDGREDVTIEVASADTDDLYVKADKSIMRESRFSGKGCCTLNAYGTYYVRAVMSNVQTTSSVTVVTTQ